jgi:uncharacterized protein YqfA (UPF0365 family)
MGPEIYLLLIVLGIIALILLTIIGKFISLWFQAFVSGTPISLFNIVGMSLRKIPPRVIVSARINSFKAGLKQISVSDLETHFMAGGNVIAVVQAMIAADKANIPLDWKRATAIDLAGRDLLEAVRTSVNPKVIDCPPQHSQGKPSYIAGVAKDGIQLLCRARVTVRTNIVQLVGGATEETIIARVGEGIVGAIGGTDTYNEVLESPQRISKLVLEKGLDSQTAFEILSIDIADIDVGENIGATLRTKKAQADMEIARAEAEKRRAMAVAAEQEWTAKVMENQAQVPLAMAEALKTGHIGYYDNLKFQNLQSDTEMRSSLGKENKGIK